MCVLFASFPIGHWQRLHCDPRRGQATKEETELISKERLALQAAWAKTDTEGPATHECVFS